MRRLMRAQHDGETSQSDWSEDEEVILFRRFSSWAKLKPILITIRLQSTLSFFMLLEGHS